MQTNVADRKLHAIELITKLEDEDLLIIIEQLLQQAQEKGDWAHDLTDLEKAAISEGLADLKVGRTIEYNDFKETLKNRFP